MSVSRRGFIGSALAGSVHWESLARLPLHKNPHLPATTGAHKASHLLGVQLQLD